VLPTSFLRKANTLSAIHRKLSYREGELSP
jgi:hypothetical protein